LRIVKLDSATIAVYAGMAIPTLVFVGVLLYQRRAWQTQKPPQQDKLLRPAGYSLGVRVEALQDQCMDSLILAGLFGVVSGGLAHFVGVQLAVGPKYIWGPALVLFFAFAGGCARYVYRAFRVIKELRNTRLGLRGEQAVAEALHESADAGYRIFHDLEEKILGNIDHIAVGPRGVFVIETKARRRRGSRNGQPEHVVSYDGRQLNFPCGYDAAALEQAERNARWLAEYLSKRTAAPVPVGAVVAIPGWYVETKGNFPVKVMNAGYLAKYLRGQSVKLEVAQVQRIVAALDDKCRNVEF
jgi:hypothetical protein